MEVSWIQILLIVVAAIVSSIVSAQKRRAQKARAHQQQAFGEADEEILSPDGWEALSADELLAQMQDGADEAPCAGMGKACADDATERSEESYADGVQLDSPLAALLHPIDSAAAVPPAEEGLHRGYTFDPAEEGRYAGTLTPATHEEQRPTDAPLQVERFGIARGQLHGINLRSAMLYDAILHRPHANRRNLRASR